VNDARFYFIASPSVAAPFAAREMLDTRIEHLSSQPQKGTKVAVE
jgi:hypothetical protein